MRLPQEARCLLTTTSCGRESPQFPIHEPLIQTTATPTTKLVFRLEDEGNHAAVWQLRKLLVTLSSPLAETPSNGRGLGHAARRCSPTRASLQTGRYTIRYGFQSGVLKPPKPYGLALNETLLPQHLARHGFVSHAVGKW